MESVLMCENMNQNVRGMPLSATLSINEKSNEMIKNGKKVYKLGLGEAPFPVPDVVVESLKQNAHKKAYLPVKGLYDLRDAVAKYYNKSQGLDFDAEDILIGPGSKELMFILQVVFYGELLLPSPSWVSYEPQARIVGRKVAWIDTYEENDWLLMPEDLENYCKKDPNAPRVIILNYPNNPTGKTYPKDLLNDLADVARKFGVIVLSDEIYGELNHNGEHISIARFYPEGTIISSGLSKWCGAGGWRLGTFAFPKNLRWLLDGMATVASETFTAVSAPIQYAAIRAFDFDDAINTYLKHSRRILKSLGNYIYQNFNAVGIRVPKPDGAFYFLPNFSQLSDQLLKHNIKNSAQLCDRVLNDASVAFLPGREFGRDTYELTARIAYVDFDGKKALDAAYSYKDEIDEDFLRKYCSNTVAAVDRICQWVKEL